MKTPNTPPTNHPEDSNLTDRVPPVYFDHFSDAEFIFRWENLISQDDGCSRNAHHVAVQLRSYMGIDGACKVGIDRLAREIKLDVRPTTTAIKELEDAGWVDVIREDNHSNRYFACIPSGMARAIQLLARERKGRTRHSYLVRATAPALVDQVLRTLGLDPASVEESEVRKVVGRVRQLLSRTYDIEWEATQIVRWVLLEQPGEVREPVGFLLARMASYGRTFKGRLTRDPRSAQIVDAAVASVVADTVNRLAEQLSVSTGHEWLTASSQPVSDPLEETGDPQMPLPFEEP